MHLNPDFLSSAVTIVWFLAFIALCVWAWSGRRRRDFDAAAQLPLEEPRPEDLKERAADGRPGSR
jgi:cytochrome c oxidase cbb3-type subunit IV